MGDRMQSPPWERARHLFDEMSIDRRHLSSQGRASLDQLQAFVRDYLDDLEVEVLDELALYHLLACLSLVTAAARWLVDADALDQAVGLELAAVCRSIATAVLPYLPAEARP